MQTFLPYHTFKESASALDWKRLGKQRVEAMQIINAIEGRPRKDGKPYKGWINHPCSVMWGDYVIALKQYANTIIDEWINRVYKNNMKFYNIKLPFEMPHWLGNKEFHSSHRANLLRKDYESTIEDYVDAIEDLIEKVGINHVGIGSDFCQDQPYSFWQYLFSQQGTKFKGIPTMTIKDPHHHPDGIEDPSQMPNIAEHLSDRGYSKLDVDKIIGGNWVRLFKTVWKQ